MLSRRALLNGLRLLVALAVMVGASPLRYAAPAFEAAGLSQGGDLAERTHGHSHDDDEDLARGDALPVQGHEHQDHSHVALGLAPSASFHVAVRLGEALRLSRECPGASHPPFLPDKPPCVLIAA